MATLVIDPITTATYLDSSVATTNFGSSTSLLVGVTSDKNGTYYKRSLLYTSISAIPAGQTIFPSSKLRLYCSVAAGSAEASSINRITQTAWTEAGATWNKYDGTTDWTVAGGDFTTPTVSFNLPTATGWLEITGSSMATFLQDAYDNRSDNVHMLLKTDTANVYQATFDSDDGTNKPQLIIDYAGAGSNTWDNQVKANISITGTYTKDNSVKAYIRNPFLSNLFTKGERPTRYANDFIYLADEGDEINYAVLTQAEKLAVELSDNSRADQASSPTNNYYRYFYFNDFVAQSANQSVEVTWEGQHNSSAAQIIGVDYLAFYLGWWNNYTQIAPAPNTDGTRTFTLKGQAPDYIIEPSTLKIHLRVWLDICDATSFQTDQIKVVLISHLAQDSSVKAYIYPGYFAQDNSAKANILVTNNTQGNSAKANISEVSAGVTSSWRMMQKYGV